MNSASVDRYARVVTSLCLWRRHFAVRCHVVVVIAMMSVVIAGCRSERPLRFLIEFPDANGLQPGQPVMCLGKKVGVVQKIDLQPPNRVVVGVEVEKASRKMIFRESVFEIAKPGGLFDGGSERFIAVKNPDNASTPLVDNQTVQGRGALMDELQRKGQQALNDLPGVARKAYVALAELTAGMQKRWTEYRDSPAGQEFLAHLDEFSRSAALYASDKTGQLRRDVLPVLRQKAVRLRDSLTSLGKTREAQQFWEEFLTWSKEAEALK